MRKIVILIIAIVLGTASSVAAYRYVVAERASLDRSHPSRSDFDTGF